MKTKKLIAVALLAALGTTVQAQIVSSQSQQVVVTQEVKPEKPKIPKKPEKPKKPRIFKWYLKAGISMDDLAGAKGVGDMSAGYDVSFGILKPTNNVDLFWGLELGVMSIGCESAYLKVTKQSALTFSPFIGYNIIDNGSLKLAPYVGLYASQALNSFPKYRDGNGWIGNESKLSGGINVGVGLWLGKNFCVDLHFRRALLKNVEGCYHSDDFNAFSQKIVLGFGLSF